MGYLEPVDTLHLASESHFHSRRRGEPAPAHKQKDPITAFDLTDLIGAAVVTDSFEFHVAMQNYHNAQLQEEEVMKQAVTTMGEQFRANCHVKKMVHEISATDSEWNQRQTHSPLPSPSPQDLRTEQDLSPNTLRAGLGGERSLVRREGSQLTPWNPAGNSIKKEATPPALKLSPEATPAVTTTATTQFTIPTSSRLLAATSASGRASSASRSGPLTRPSSAKSSFLEGISSRVDGDKKLDVSSPGRLASVKTPLSPGPSSKFLPSLKAGSSPKSANSPISSLSQPFSHLNSLRPSSSSLGLVSLPATSDPSRNEQHDRTPTRDRPSAPIQKVSVISLGLGLDGGRGDRRTSVDGNVSNLGPNGRRRASSSTGENLLRR